MTPVALVAPVVKQVKKEVVQTEAEKKLKEEDELAKKKLNEEIKQFKQEDSAKESNAEPEDPRVQKFTVANPVKIGGHVKYSVTGVDDDGEFTDVRRFREFHALG